MDLHWPTNLCQIIQYFWDGSKRLHYLEPCAEIRSLWCACLRSRFTVLTDGPDDDISPSLRYADQRTLRDSHGNIHANFSLLDKRKDRRLLKEINKPFTGDFSVETEAIWWRYAVEVAAYRLIDWYSNGLEAPAQTLHRINTRKTATRFLCSMPLDGRMNTGFQFRLVSIPEAINTFKQYKSPQSEPVSNRPNAMHEHTIKLHYLFR